MFYSSVITGNSVNSSDFYCGLTYAAFYTPKNNKYIIVLTSNVELTGIPLRMVAVGE
jgi:hypothetical protein